MYKRQVISSDGKQLGIMSSKEALALAEQKNLDLVKIAPQSVPPVCKIIDVYKRQVYIYDEESSKEETYKASNWPGTKMNYTMWNH